MSMRSHSDIIKDAGAEAIASIRDVPVNTVRAWAFRDSIPAQHWQALVTENLTTLDELARAAATRPAKAAA